MKWVVSPARWSGVSRRAAVVSALAIFACAGATAHADGDLLDRWFAAQGEIKTWSADLVQTRTLRALKEPLKTSGRVWFAAPNRFRWELGDPPQTIAVRESDAMLILYPKLQRAERYPLLPGSGGPWSDALTLLEAGFPQNRKELERRFEIASFADQGATASLELKPRSARARRLIEGVRLEFGRDDLQLRATELKFADGSTLRNDFSGTKLNPDVGESRFSASIPAGYKVTEPLRGSHQ